MDGVDAIFVGPGDLSANMGYLGNIANDDVRAALKAGVDAAHAAGKPCGIVGQPRTGALGHRAGLRLLACGLMSMPLARAKEQLSAIRAKKSRPRVACTDMSTAAMILTHGEWKAELRPDLGAAWPTRLRGCVGIAFWNASKAYAAWPATRWCRIPTALLTPSLPTAVAMSVCV